MTPRRETKAEFQIRLGRELRAARKAAKLTQEEAAAWLSTTPSRYALGRWETGQFMPDPLAIVELGMLYGMPLGWPFGKRDEAGECDEDGEK